MHCTISYILEKEKANEIQRGNNLFNIPQKIFINVVFT